MKRWWNLGTALTLALAVTACAGDRSPDADTDATDRTAYGDATAGTSGRAEGDAAEDRQFVEEQLAMGVAEIELGQLAEQRGTHPEVKRFGEMMVREHRAAGEELKRLSTELAKNQTTGTSGTADMRDDHREATDELKEASGAEFDRKYIDRMVDDHEKAVKELERRAENANDPEVRQWAAKTLPKVQQHLERAKMIQETLESNK